MANDKSPEPQAPSKPTMPAPAMNPSGTLQAQQPPLPGAVRAPSPGTVDAPGPAAPGGPADPTGRHNPALSELVGLRVQSADLERRAADDTYIATLKARIAQLEAGGADARMQARAPGKGGAYLAHHQLVLGGPAKPGPNGTTLPGDRRVIEPGAGFEATDAELDGLVEGVHYTRGR